MSEVEQGETKKIAAKLESMYRKNYSKFANVDGKFTTEIKNFIEWLKFWKKGHEFNYEIIFEEVNQIADKDKEQLLSVIQDKIQANEDSIKLDNHAWSSISAVVALFGTVVTFLSSSGEGKITCAIGVVAIFIVIELILGIIYLYVIKWRVQRTEEKRFYELLYRYLTKKES